MAQTVGTADRRGPASQAAVRLRNLWLVLGIVRAARATSRVQIAAEAGLTPTTVHRLTDALERRGLVRRVEPAERNGSGRPPVWFEFHARAGHVVGIDVGNETTRAALADLRGEVLARTSRSTASIETDLPSALGALIAELQREAGLRPDALVAVGVGVAAVTGAEGTIVRASMHHLWEGLQLGLRLRRDLGCDVHVAQDDYLAALAELRIGGCVGVRDALVVNAGKGVGAAIIADGDVYRGAHGAAGRVGWIPVVPLSVPGSLGAADDSSDAPRLAALLTADGLIAEYRRAGGDRGVRGARDVFEADCAGDPAACHAVDAFADRLGWLVGTGVAIVDPQRVVIGGGISGSFDRIAPRLIAGVESIVAVAPPIVASTLGSEAVVTGAIAAAMTLADDWLMARLRL